MICYHIHDDYEEPISLERHAFYGEPITPTAIFDGTNSVFVESPPFKDPYLQYIDLARSVTPYFNLYINSATATTTTGSIDLRIVAADTIPQGEIVAFVAILEDSLQSALIPSWFFDHVCRDMFQFPVELAYPDSLDTTIVFSHTISVNHMKTVAFVQNIVTKEVMQAVISTFQEE